MTELEAWKKAKEQELSRFYGKGTKLVPANSQRRIRPLKEQLVIFGDAPTELKAPNGKVYWVLRKYQAPSTRKKPTEPVSPQVQRLIERLRPQ